MSLLCLQGGAEFGPGTRPMDADLLQRAGGGPVVVTALAGARGREYRTAGENGVRHFRALGATDASVAPDVREDPAGAVAALRSARLLVLPGGSPSRLLDVLRTTPVGDLLAELLDDDVLVAGSSAGAMVVCEWTVLPDRGGGPHVARGVGLVPSVLVVPHWRGRSDWLAVVEGTVPPDVEVLGLPEESGVLVQGEDLTAVGVSGTTRVRSGQEMAPGSTWSLHER